MRNGWNYIFMDFSNGMTPSQREAVADEVVDTYRMGKYSRKIKGETYEGRVKILEGFTSFGGFSGRKATAQVEFDSKSKKGRGRADITLLILDGAVGRERRSEPSLN